MASITVPVLQPPLTDDVHSRIHFSNYKKSLANAAQSMCRTIDDCGAYSLVASDAEWNAHQLNILTAANGTVTYRPRPNIVKPTMYAPTEKRTAVVNIFNHQMIEFKEWTQASMALHQAMINSVGPLNLATIDRLSGHAGVVSLTCRELITHITTIFGTLRPSDVFYIEASIKEELSAFADFRDFISRNSLNYDILQKVPHQIGNISKIQWLETSLQRYPQFDIPIHTWKSTNTDVAARTYEDLVQYLMAQYSSLSADTQPRGGSAFEAHGKGHAGGNKRNRRRGRGRGRGQGDPKRQRQSDPAQSSDTTHAHGATATPAPAPASTPAHSNDWDTHSTGPANSAFQATTSSRLHQWSDGASPTTSSNTTTSFTQQPKTAEHKYYCALHGWNLTHNGADCRHMLRNPNTYSQRHIHAKRPTDCNNPRGNGHVQYIPPRLH
jgi:hypothetical protein